MYEILIEGCGWLSVSYFIWRTFQGPRCLNGMLVNALAFVEN